MKNAFLNLGLGLSLLLSNAVASLAVSPAPIASDARVRWSTVLEDPFEGTIVYDKHYSDKFALVTSWARSGIRATYSEFDEEITGYTTVWETRRFKDKNGKERKVEVPVQQPVYKKVRSDRTPQAILLLINGKVHTYEKGPVSAALARALANAPDANLPIRLVWEDAGTMDMVIGKGTVAAWKTIFR